MYSTYFHISSVHPEERRAGPTQLGSKSFEVLLLSTFPLIFKSIHETESLWFHNIRRWRKVWENYDLVRLIYLSHQCTQPEALDLSLYSPSYLYLCTHSHVVFLVLFFIIILLSIGFLIVEKPPPSLSHFIELSYCYLALVRILPFPNIFPAKIEITPVFLLLIFNSILLFIHFYFFFDLLIYIYILFIIQSFFPFRIEIHRSCRHCLALFFFSNNPFPSFLIDFLFTRISEWDGKKK